MFVNNGLLTVKEAAEWLRISTRYLYNLTKTGKIMARSCGRRVLYSEAELSRFREALPVKVHADGQHQH